GFINSRVSLQSLGSLLPTLRVGMKIRSAIRSDEDLDEEEVNSATSQFAYASRSIINYKMLTSGNFPVVSEAVLLLVARFVTNTVSFLVALELVNIYSALPRANNTLLAVIASSVSVFMIAINTLNAAIYARRSRFSGLVLIVQLPIS